MKNNLLFVLQRILNIAKSSEIGDINLKFFL